MTFVDFPARAPRRSICGAALTLLALAASQSASAQALLLHDTFDADTVGLPPSGPLVGSATYGTGVLIGTRIGDYTVVDVGGARQLQVTPLGPVGDPANGTLIEYNPLPSAATGRHVHYDFQVQPGGDSAGVNGWMQEITFGPIGTNLALDWGASTSGRSLVLATSTPGCCGGGYDLTDLGLSYVPGEQYRIDWYVDMAADRYSLFIDGVARVSNASFGDDVQSMGQLVFDSNFETTGSALVDDVLIEVVPEPPAWALMAAGLALAGGLRAGARRRSRR